MIIYLGRAGTVRACVRVCVCVCVCVCVRPHVDTEGRSDSQQADNQHGWICDLHVRNNFYICLWNKINI